MTIQKGTVKGKTKYRFSVVYEIDGEKKRKASKWFDRKREAAQAEVDFMISLEKEPPKKVVRFQDVFWQWADATSQGYNRKVWDEKHKMIPKWFPELMYKPIEEISSAHLRQIFSNHRAFQELSTSRKNRLLEYVNGVFDYAQRFYGLQSNPMSAIDRYRKTETERLREVQIYTVSQFEIFIEVIPKEYREYRNLFYTLYYTGLRLNECLSLTFNDIQDGKIRVYHQYDHKTKQWSTLKTKASRRFVPFDGGVAKVFEEQRRKYEKEPGFEKGWFIFGGNRHLPYSPIERVKNAAIEKTELPMVKIHSFRHSYASNLIRAGIPLFKVSRLLGHSSIATTSDIYGHLMQDEDDDILAAIRGQK